MLAFFKYVIVGWLCSPNANLCRKSVYRQYCLTIDWLAMSGQILLEMFADQRISFVDSGNEI